MTSMWAGVITGHTATSRSFMGQSSAQIWNAFACEVVIHAKALRRVHGKLIELREGYESQGCGFVRRAKLTADYLGCVAGIELLADLTVGVRDYVPRVGIDPDQPGDLDVKPGLLAYLANRTCG